MYCTTCGVQLQERDRFCSQCGTATATGTPRLAGTEYSRLARPRDDRKIAGVCAGIARYFGVDPVLVRILAVALLIWPTGLGLVIYIVCWIVMPNEPYLLPASSNSVTTSDVT
jgi:phage shock protein C